MVFQAKYPWQTGVWILHRPEYFLMHYIFLLKQKVILNKQINNKPTWEMLHILCSVCLLHLLPLVQEHCQVYGACCSGCGWACYAQRACQTVPWLCWSDLVTSNVICNRIGPRYSINSISSRAKDRSVFSIISIKFFTHKYNCLKSLCNSSVTLSNFVLSICLPLYNAISSLSY